MIKEGAKNQAAPQEVAQMLRDYIQNPHTFYADLFAAMKADDISRPGKELADWLGLAESVANRYARQRESDEAPTGTGARSDLERLIMTFKLAVRHDLETAQTLVNALQQLVDDGVERWADAFVNADPERFREFAMRESADVVISIGANKPACEVLREEAESRIATKKYLAVKRRRESSKRTA